MKTNFKMALVLALPILAGCMGGNENITEVSKLEAQGAFEAQRIRSLELEADLEKRQGFYQRVAGTYEGELQGPAGTFQIRVKLVPSLPYFKPSRVRLPDEVANDLNNLYFNVQVHQWRAGDTLGAVGCKALQVKPDLETGKIKFPGADCSSFYELQIAEKTSRSMSQAARDEESSLMAARLREGDPTPVQLLVGEVAPSSSSQVFKFTAERL